MFSQMLMLSPHPMKMSTCSVQLLGFFLKSTSCQTILVEAILRSNQLMSQHTSARRCPRKKPSLARRAACSTLRCRWGSGSSRWGVSGILWKAAIGPRSLGGRLRPRSRRSKSRPRRSAFQIQLNPEKLEKSRFKLNPTAGQKTGQPLAGLDLNEFDAKVS